MTCPTGKRGWSSERQAKRGLRSIKTTHGTMHAYKCDTCPHWHIGHNGMLGDTWQPEFKPAPGYQRPTDVFTGFVVVGAHQVLFGTEVLTITGPPLDLRRGLADLELPEGLLHELIALDMPQATNTLLTATPEQLDQIKAAWASHHPTTPRTEGA